MVTPEARYFRWRTTAITVWAIIGILVLAAIALWALGKIAAALVPFVIAFILVFLLNWPVNALSRRGIPRGLAVLICFVVTFAVLGAAVTLLAPPAGRQIMAFVRTAPGAFTALETTAEHYGQRFSRIVFPEWISALVKSASAQLAQIAVDIGNRFARSAVSAGGGVAAGFFDFVIALVIAFWALKDLPKMREELVALAGPKYESDAEQLITTVTRVVGGYLKGQTIASFATGTLVAVGLALFHVPYALVLGIITFFFNYVPYVGPFTAGLIAALVGLTVGPWTSVAAVVVILIAHNFTDSVITPRVMSGQVDLHPTLVIFSLLVGGALFGVPGMLFAIPVAATGKGLFVYYYERRTQRQLASENGALFRGAGPDAESEGSADDAGAS